MNSKTIWITAIILSFVVYLFPIPALHLTQTWGAMLWGMWHSNLNTYLERILFLIFAIGYQGFAVYCIYQLYLMQRSKILLFSLGYLIFFYVGLVIAVYALGLLIFSIENMLGILPT